MAPRKQLTLKRKLEVIQDLDNGLKQVEAAKKYGISQSTIATFIKKREEIENSVLRIDPKRIRNKSATNEAVDEATLKWFFETRAQNIPVNGPMLCDKATKFASMMGITNFKGSNGWLMRFRNRQGIVFQGIHGEEKAVPIKDANLWRQREILKIMEKFPTGNIYNADEAGLFFGMLPDKTLAFKGEKCKGGKKSKQRLTVLLCVNLDGTHQLKPVVIGKSVKPRCFKNVKSLPVDYMANNRAWMTSKFFNEWLEKLNNEMIRKKKKIALLVDNCTPHNSAPKMSNVEVYYFPPNCTSVLQPLDMGIIKCFKGFYRKRLVEAVIFNVDQNHPAPFKVNVKQACDWIAGSWSEVKPQTIRNCWRKAGFKMDSTDEENFDCEETSPSLKESLKVYAETIGKNVAVSVSDYLEADNDILNFAEATDEDIVAEVTNLRGEDDDGKEDEENCPNSTPKVMSTEEVVQSIQALQTWLSSLPAVKEEYLNSLDGLKSMCVAASVNKKRKQAKISDFFMGST